MVSKKLKKKVRGSIIVTTFSIGVKKGPPIT